MRKEDEDSLGGRHEREDDVEQKLGDLLWNRRFDVAKDPAHTDRHEDGQINAEFLFAIALIGLGRTSERFLDLSSDEKEENDVDRDDDDAWHEESTKRHVRIDDIANSFGAAGRDGSVFLESSDNNDNDGRHSPGAEVIPLFEELRLSVALDDHLIEVERNAERPAEVGQQEIMRHKRHDNTQPLISCHPVEIGNAEEGVSHHDT